jgi:hypothetical protein
VDVAGALKTCATDTPRVMMPGWKHEAVVRFTPDVPNHVARHDSPLRRFLDNQSVPPVPVLWVRMLRPAGLARVERVKLAGARVDAGTN